MSTITIAVLAYRGISPFHLCVPGMVFGDERLQALSPNFDIRICALERGALPTTAGFTLKTEHGLAAMDAAQIVIVPSWRDPDELPPKALLQALRAAHARGAKIVGLCLGTFVLAAAGLLENRQAATHWSWADDLQRRYPSVRVQPEVLYVDDGQILTSAGVAAGIDCCLHLLRTLCGSEVSNGVARFLVVPPHRQGGQAQYIEQPLRPTPQVDRFAQVLDEVLLTLDQPQRLDDLAQRTLMSRSTFTRRFKASTGTTLGQWLLNQRLTLARRLLETTDKTVESIADEAGFGSALSLRQHFKAQLQTSPRRYREAFKT